MQNFSERIKNFHQYLVNQTIYPIILSTAFALVLFGLRTLQSYSIAYANLIWNLFLAWLPFLFSLWTAALYTSRPDRRWVIILPGFLWLLFFPNAPYIITDFLHLKDLLSYCFTAHDADAGKKSSRLVSELDICWRCAHAGRDRHLSWTLLALE